MCRSFCCAPRAAPWRIVRNDENTTHDRREWNGNGMTMHAFEWAGRGENSSGGDTQTHNAMQLISREYTRLKLDVAVRFGVARSAFAYAPNSKQMVQLHRKNHTELSSPWCHAAMASCLGNCTFSMRDAKRDRKGAPSERDTKSDLQRENSEGTAREHRQPLAGVCASMFCFEIKLREQRANVHSLCTRHFACLFLLLPCIRASFAVIPDHFLTLFSFFGIAQGQTKSVCVWVLRARFVICAAIPGRDFRFADALFSRWHQADLRERVATREIR